MTKTKHRKKPMKSAVPRYCDNQQQAAKLLDVSPALLRQAKREGAPGFRSGRVYVEEVKAWLTANKIEAEERLTAKQALSHRLLLVQVQRMEEALHRDKSQYRLASDMDRRLRGFQADMNAALLAKRSQIPIELRATVWDKVHKEILDEFQAAFELTAAEPNVSHTTKVS
jgi:hypothetical protein